MRDKNSSRAFCSGVLCIIRVKILAAFLFHGVSFSKEEKHTYIPPQKKKKKVYRLSFGYVGDMS